MLKVILNETNDKIIRKHFNTYSQILKRSIKISRKKEYIRQINKSDNKYKTMWRIINRNTGKTINKNHKNIILKDNNVNVECPVVTGHSTLTVDIVISNIFNKHFSSVGKTSNNNKNTGHSVINSPATSM